MTEPLNEYDKVEWLDIARMFMPDITEAQFDEMWAEFQAKKAQKALS